ncbi:MAG: HAD-IIB family hydrolase [Thermodesulfobacteriota bacterium]
MKPVIFTDLDGTLLKATDYSFAEALPALERIKERGIPLVIASSKTRAEIEAVRARLGTGGPFISENGGGVYIPQGCFPFPVEGSETGGYTVIVLGTPYGEVRKAFEEIRVGLGVDIRGFGDMTAGEVSEVTGLAPEDAAFALEREFDEPFLFKGDGGDGGDGERLRGVLDEIERRGFRWTRGRLLHMLGPHDKGRAVRILKRHYTGLYGKVVAIGLGDGWNDMEMLREVERPVLVRREDGTHEEPPREIPGLLRADGVGPAGWNSAVIDILEEIDR